MRRATLFVVAALGLVVAVQAGAHAEIGPEQVPAGSVSTFALSVEGEEASPTTKVALQLPRGVTNAKPAPTPGWKAKRGGRVITWTGGRIPEGERAKFEISAKFPNTPGKTLVFPVVQTYRDGTVVRWIGTRASETPAPRIELTAASAQPPAPPPPTATTTTPTTTAASENDDDDNGSAGWIIGAAIVVGLIAAGAALFWRRRS